MRGLSFPYRTRVEKISPGGVELEIERLESLEQTIDEFFREYEKNADPELFASRCPYFGEPWPAGIALAAHCAGQAPRWRGASVRELGCGLALPSLVLAKGGLKPTATDYHPDVPIFLGENCRRNDVRVEYEELDWQGEGGGAQVLLGSDLLYDRAQAPSLLEFLGRVRWNEAVFSDPGRPYWENFVRAAREKWEVEEFLRDGIFFARLLRA